MNHEQRVESDSSKKASTESLGKRVADLHSHVNSCAEAWRSGYDDGGFEWFERSLKDFEALVTHDFDDDCDELVQMMQTLPQLQQAVENRDIMAVQDTVEYEWWPAVEAWQTRLTGETDVVDEVASADCARSGGW